MKGAPILQADDDENDVLLLQYVFRAARLPSPLHSVTDGQDAMDYLAGTGHFADRSRHPFPCLVLLDIKMPRKGGFEVLQWIRSQPSLRSLVVIMFTASANRDEIELAYQMGANSFIIKPAGTDKLEDVVKALHAYWVGYNQFGPLCTIAPVTEPMP
jgi:CheY-like chemotaxis protein